MLPEFRMPEVFSEAREQFVPIVAPSRPRREALQLGPNTWCEGLIDNVIGPMTDDSGAPLVSLIWPVIKPVNLLVEFCWKGPHPRAQFLCNKFFQNSSESVPLAKVLIAGCFINKRDNANGGKAVLQDRGACRQMLPRLA